MYPCHPCDPNYPNPYKFCQSDYYCRLIEFNQIFTTYKNFCESAYCPPSIEDRYYDFMRPKMVARKFTCAIRPTYNRRNYNCPLVSKPIAKPPGIKKEKVPFPCRKEEEEEESTPAVKCSETNEEATDDCDAIDMHEEYSKIMNSKTALNKNSPTKCSKEPQPKAEIDRGDYSQSLSKNSTCSTAISKCSNSSCGDSKYGDNQSEISQCTSNGSNNESCMSGLPDSTDNDSKCGNGKRDASQCSKCGSKVGVSRRSSQKSTDNKCARCGSPCESSRCGSFNNQILPGVNSSIKRISSGENDSATDQKKKCRCSWCQKPIAEDTTDNSQTTCNSSVQPRARTIGGNDYMPDVDPKLSQDISKTMKKFYRPIERSKSVYRSTKALQEPEKSASESSNNENRSTTKNGVKGQRAMDGKCAELFVMMHDNIVETVQKSVDNLIKTYCNKTLSQVEGLCKKVEQNEAYIEMIYNELLQKIAQNENEHKQQYQYMMQYFKEFEHKAAGEKNDRKQQSKKVVEKPKNSIGSHESRRCVRHTGGHSRERSGCAEQRRIKNFTKLSDLYPGDRMHKSVQGDSEKTSKYTSTSTLVNNDSNIQQNSSSVVSQMPSTQSANSQPSTSAKHQHHHSTGNKKMASKTQNTDGSSVGNNNYAVKKNNAPLETETSSADFEQNQEVGNCNKPMKRFCGDRTEYGQGIWEPMIMVRGRTFSDERSVGLNERYQIPCHHHHHHTHNVVQQQQQPSQYHQHQPQLQSYSQDIRIQQKPSDPSRLTAGCEHKKLLSALTAVHNNVLDILDKTVMFSDNIVEKKGKSSVELPADGSQKSSTPTKPQLQSGVIARVHFNTEGSNAESNNRPPGLKGKRTFRTCFVYPTPRKQPVKPEY